MLVAVQHAAGRRACVVSRFAVIVCERLLCVVVGCLGQQAVLSVHVLLAKGHVVPSQSLVVERNLLPGSAVVAAQPAEGRCLLHGGDERKRDDGYELHSV